MTSSRNDPLTNPAVSPNVATRIVIVDDEAPARLRLRQLLSDIATDFPHRLTGEAATANDALALISGAADDAGVEIVLLDVQMPGMNGIQLARHLSALPRPPTIVFVTAFDEYAVTAFEVHAVDYLMKPVRAQRLLGALQRAVDRRGHRHNRSGRTADSDAVTSAARELARNQQTSRREHIAVHERGRLLLVPVAEIVYLKAELKYVTVRTAEREYLIEESLTALEQEFVERMVRVHRNALVARDSIAGFERAEPSIEGEATSEPHWQVVLKGVSERLPVSRRQWPVIKAMVK